MTEADLAPLAKAGDRRAVEELLRRARPQVERIAWRTLQFVRTPFDVTDDAVSVGLLAVWRTIPAWPDGVGLIRFARKNVRKAVLSIAYRRGFAVGGHAAPSSSLDAPVSEDSDTTASDLLPAEDDPLEPAIDVARVLSALPPQEADVLLRHSAGEDFSEIGPTKQAAHKRYHRAIARAHKVAHRRHAA